MARAPRERAADSVSAGCTTTDALHGDWPAGQRAGRGYCATNAETTAWCVVRRRLSARHPLGDARLGGKTMPDNMLRLNWVCGSAWPGGQG